MKDCFLQLGSLCKGLVKVGGHLERTNPFALGRLQVVQWHDFWSNASYGTGCCEGFATILHFFQVLLTNLCQDSSLDIVLRLQLLEVSFTNRGGNADTIVKLTRPEVFFMAGDWVAQSGLEAWPHSGEILWREVCQFSLWLDVGPVIHLLSWACDPCIREHSVVYLLVNSSVLRIGKFTDQKSNCGESSVSGLTSCVVQVIWPILLLIRYVSVEKTISAPDRRRAPDYTVQQRTLLGGG